MIDKKIDKDSMLKPKGNLVLKVHNLTKTYRLGEVGTGTLSHDLNRWFAKMRGKEDPFSTIGSINDRTAAAGKIEYVNVLSQLNFEVEKGEVLGIIGKNGAGKSTLLKVISQITSPSTGSIKAKGRIASLLEVGTGMHPEMTGRENVYLNGTLLGMTKKEIDVKFDEIVGFAGCAKYVDTPVKRYSSGMKVRLGFAVAAFLEPEILIVDEVLAVGDAEFQTKAVGKMKEISAGGGRTVLFVSHNMASIQNLCTRLLVLNQGSVQFLGTVEQGIDEYLKSNDIGDEGLVKNREKNGSGELKIVSVETSRRKEIKPESFESAVTGEEFFIKVNLNIEEDIENVILSVGFFSNLNKVFYTSLRSDCIARTFDFKKGDASVVFHIEKFPFMESSYSLNLLAKTRYGIIDWIKDACVLSVINGDFYNSGVLPNSGKEGLCLDFKIISHANNS